jgi:50S ribosomal protein L16 3-hydroxylase
LTTKVNNSAWTQSAPSSGRQLLGGFTADEFLYRHWQKKPLLIPRAFPAFQSFITRRRLVELSRRPEVESRIVLRKDAQWEVLHGPFKLREFKTLPPSHWTLLVHGVNLYVPEADRLLRAFNFIPYSRLDDVMVSYAAPEGGVGPHFDSYDVFLLQAAGQRRWQVSEQRDRTLERGAPLKVLRRFKPRQEWVLQPGDMLYLPPGYAHNGIAVQECITCSIGFRAPSAQELARAFLAYLEDTLQLSGLYEDPALKATSEPARISETMLAQVKRMLKQIRWSRSDVARFLGCYLTEPKAQVFFEAPASSFTFGEFRRRARSSAFELDPKTQMLFRSHILFVNGEAYPLGDSGTLKQLANERALAPNPCLDPHALKLLYEWYLAGYVHFVEP